MRLSTLLTEKALECTAMAAASTGDDSRNWSQKASEFRAAADAAEGEE